MTKFKNSIQHLKEYLDEKVEEYNQPEFIPMDPISIPHQYAQQQDIEITGFFASILAWGQRKTIINKCNELFALMDNAPYDFILNHTENDLKPLLSFKHRTFNATDTLYFLHFLQNFYQRHESLEEAFIVKERLINQPYMQSSLSQFHELFFSLPEAPQRTKKHIATPARKSACKRLNMYLRWMVRKDDKGIDFGIWNRLKMKDLICPCDVHVDRVARKLGLINRKQTDWQTAVELTDSLRELDPHDPVKYDFALFGIGVMEGVH